MNLDLSLYPSPILEEECDPVEDPTAHGPLIDRMNQIMHERDGVGLAAPQVGEAIRLFVICVDLEEKRNEVFINPEIKTIENKETVEEGCLSFPNIRVDLERGLYVEVEAMNQSGDRILRTLEGIQAQCVQHEIDHLNGKTLLDRCNLSQKMAINDKIQTLKEGGIPEPPEDPSIQTESKKS